MTDIDAIARLLRPRSVAVIGASADAAKTAGRPVAYLRKHGFTGDLHLVNPRADTVLGERAHPTLAEVPGPIDLAYLLLGTEHVDRSLAKAGDFGTPWQDFITRYAWGEIWGDETLPWKTRSVVTLAIMVALGREEEFKLHVRPALGNGVTPGEMRALLKQCAVYAGVPAANAAFRWVKEVLGEELG